MESIIDSTTNPTQGKQPKRDSGKSGNAFPLLLEAAVELQTHNPLFEKTEVCM